jgi:hypothetical protein
MRLRAVALGVYFDRLFQKLLAERIEFGHDRFAGGLDGG